jgi:hypothetical protein
MSTKKEITFNPSFPSLLTLVFVVMKCMGYIDWSWWLVFSPILIMIAISVVLFAIIIVFK